MLPTDQLAIFSRFANLLHQEYLTATGVPPVKVRCFHWDARKVAKDGSGRGVGTFHTDYTVHNHPYASAIGMVQDYFDLRSSNEAIIDFLHQGYDVRFFNFWLTLSAPSKNGLVLSLNPKNKRLPISYRGVDGPERFYMLYAEDIFSRDIELIWRPTDRGQGWIFPSDRMPHAGATISAEDGTLFLDNLRQSVEVRCAVVAEP